MFRVERVIGVRIESMPMVYELLESFMDWDRVVSDVEDVLKLEIRIDVDVLRVQVNADMIICVLVM